ncbi:MAG: alpha/beta fold hydrolase [Promethearchaeia archaeon]
MEERYAKVNGVNLCYLIDGEGFPVILIHGYGAKKEVWKPQIVDLSKYFKVIAYDIRGIGKSERPDYPYTMDILADDLKGLLDFLGIKKSHIIGRSLGGMIAQNFALKYPEYVEKLVLITTNSGVPDESAVDMMIESAVNELNLMRENPEKAFLQKAKLVFHHDFRRKIFSNPEQEFYGGWSLKKQIEESMINPPEEKDLRNLGHAIKTHNTRDRLDKIKAPTLLIAGSHDRLTPRNVMELINKKIQNSKLIVLEKAGHFLNISRAEEVNRLILDFLNK